MASSKRLKNISEIRRYFHRNEQPIYFVSATNFNLLGLDEWVRNFKYINYLDCYDGRHPNVFCPTEDAARRIPVHRGHQQLPAAAQGGHRLHRKTAAASRSSSS